MSVGRTSSATSCAAYVRVNNRKIIDNYQSTSTAAQPLTFQVSGPLTATANSQIYFYRGTSGPCAVEFSVYGRIYDAAAFGDGMYRTQHTQHA